MRETNDGFVLAERDLDCAVPGELLGTRQTGLAAFRIADLARDAAAAAGACAWPKRCCCRTRPMRRTASSTAGSAARRVSPPPDPRGYDAPNWSIGSLR
jgi:ATP-dependent DNA helicase RecG